MPPCLLSSALDAALFGFTGIAAAAVEIAKISVLGFSAPVCRLVCHGTDAPHVTAVVRGLLPN
jgi:hypothetical protein